MDGLTYDARHETYRRLSQLQAGHAKWLAHNFPNQMHHHGLLGVVEELGELTHAHLKSEQGIRGYDGYDGYMAVREEVGDAIGDIIVYLMSYCNTNGYDIGKCLERAWEEVRERDWQAHKETGTAKADAEQPSTAQDS